MVFNRVIGECEVRSAKCKVRSPKSEVLCVLLIAVLAAPVLAQDTPAAPADAEATKVTITEKPAEPPPAPPPMELQPYRVRISVAFEEHPMLTARTRQDVLSGLTTWIDRTFGDMWIATIEENHWLTPENEEGLSRLTSSSIDAQLADNELDKAFVVSVSGSGSVLRVCGREWDRMTQQVSVRQERIVADRRALTDELGLVIRNLFRPLVLVESAGAGTCKVRVRAGELALSAWCSNEPEVTGARVKIGEVRKNRQ